MVLKEESQEDKDQHEEYCDIKTEENIFLAHSLKRLCQKKELERKRPEVILPAVTVERDFINKITLKST